MTERESRPAIHETAPHYTAESTAPDVAPRARRRVRQARTLTQGAILALLEEHGAMTDDELYRRYLAAGYADRSRQNTGTVRHELVMLGKVRETSVRGLSDRGNLARLWERVPDDPEAELLATAAASALADPAHDHLGG